MKRVIRIAYTGHNKRPITVEISDGSHYGIQLWLSEERMKELVGYLIKLQQQKTLQGFTMMVEYE